MKRIFLLLILLLAGCASTSDVDILKIKNDIIEIRDSIEKNNQLDQQNWLLDIYQQKKIDALLNDLEQKRI